MNNQKEVKKMPNKMKTAWDLCFKGLLLWNFQSINSYATTKIPIVDDTISSLKAFFVEEDLTLTQKISSAKEYLIFEQNKILDELRFDSVSEQYVAVIGYIHLMSHHHNSYPMVLMKIDEDVYHQWSKSSLSFYDTFPAKKKIEDDEVLNTIYYGEVYSSGGNEIIDNFNKLISLAFKESQTIPWITSTVNKFKNDASEREMLDLLYIGDQLALFNILAMIGTSSYDLISEEIESQLRIDLLLSAAQKKIEEKNDISKKLITLDKHRFSPSRQWMRSLYKLTSYR